MTETPNNDRDRIIDEIRDEFEVTLLQRGGEEVRPRRFSAPFASRLPRRFAPVLAALALSAGSAGIAVAAMDTEEESLRPPPEIVEVTNASGDSIEFKCEADRQWFFDHIEGGADLPVKEFPETLPVPPKGLCEGSPPLTD